MDYLSIFWDMLQTGQFSDWVLTTVVFKTVQIIDKNFLLLWTIYQVWAWIASKTKWKWDDKLSAMFGKALLKFRSWFNTQKKPEQIAKIPDVSEEPEETEK